MNDYGNGFREVGDEFPNPFVFCCTTSWLSYAAVLIKRIDELHQFATVHYIVIIQSKNMSKDNFSISEFRSYFRESRIDLRIIEVPETVVTSRVDTTNSRLPSATYLRCLIPDLLQNENYAIYLDVDVWVERNLNHILFLKPFTAIAAHNMFWSIESNRLYRNHDENYFLVGTMVLNLNRLREIDFTNKVFKILQENKSMVNMEMDAINLLLEPMNEISNLNSNFCWLANYPKIKNPSREGYLYQSPAIVHFNGPKKPWSSRPLLRTWEKKWREFYKKSGFPLNTESIDVLPYSIVESGNFFLRVYRRCVWVLYGFWWRALK